MITEIVEQHDLGLNIRAIKLLRRGRMILFFTLFSHNIVE